jgi:hypothetical protein
MDARIGSARRRWAVAPAAVLIVLAAALLAGAVTPATGGDAFDTEAIVRAAGPAPWRGDGIVHAQIRADDGRVYEEEWLNRRTGQTRRERKGSDANSTVSDGLRTWRWYPFSGHLYLTEVHDQRDPWLRPASLLLEVWRDLRAGRAWIVGEGEVGGTPTWIVEVKPGSEAPPGFRAFAEVEKETFLLRRRFSSEGRGLVIERDEVPETSVPARFFSPPPDRRWTTREGRLRYADLAAAVPFPAYAPRPDSGLRFAYAVLAEQRGESAAGLPAEERRKLYLAYARGGDTYDRAPFQLIETRRAARAERWFRVLRRAGKLTHVTIAGRKREALVGHGPSQRISVLLPGTFVHGWSELDREQTLALLAALRRVR